MQIVLRNCILLLLLLGFWSGNTPTKASDFMLGGIHVNEPDHRAWVQQLHRSGMNTVSVTVYARQGDWDSDNLWFDETDEAVISEIKAAKAQNVKVVLILRVALDHAYSKNQFLWHGMIMPKTDEQLDSWFTKYGNFVKQWATISEELGVDMLAIGSEMNQLTATVPIKKLPELEEYYLNPKKQQKHRERQLAFAEEIQQKDLWVRGTNNFESLTEYTDARIAKNEAWAKQVSFDESKDSMNNRRVLLDYYWRTLIEDTRTIYKGQLSYAANFDNYNVVSFWDALDVVGINAYFPVRDFTVAIEDSTELYKHTFKKWKGHLKAIDDFRIKNNIDSTPVVFTELGYTYRSNCTVEPWKGYGFSFLQKEAKTDMIVWTEQSQNFRERATAVNALYDAQKEINPNMLKGILYWKLTTKDYHVKEEPFALYLSDGGIDPMLPHLLKFLK